MNEALVIEPLMLIGASLLAHLLGMSWPAAVLTGGAAAMCSTGIALNQLQDSGELAQPHGRIATGVLLFQDIATLPFLVVIDSSSATGTIAFLPALRQLGAAADSDSGHERGAAAPGRGPSDARGRSAFDGVRAAADPSQPGDRPLDRDQGDRALATTRS